MHTDLLWLASFCEGVYERLPPQIVRTDRVIFILSIKFLSLVSSTNFRQETKHILLTFKWNTKIKTKELHKDNMQEDGSCTYGLLWTWQRKSMNTIWNWNWKPLPHITSMHPGRHTEVLLNTHAPCFNEVVDAIITWYDIKCTPVPDVCTLYRPPRTGT